MLLGLIYISIKIILLFSITLQQHESLWDEFNLVDKRNVLHESFQPRLSLLPHAVCLWLLFM